MSTDKSTSKYKNGIKDNGKDITYLFGFSGVESSSGRISNALSMNIAIKKAPNLLDLLDGASATKLSVSDDVHYIDRRGKALALSVEDIQVVKALSSYIPFTDPDIQDFIKAINTLKPDGSTSSPIKKKVQIPVSALQLSKDIIGDTKEASLRKIGDRLKRLAEIQQAQTFFIGENRYKLVKPLIHIDGAIYKSYSEIRSSKGRKKSVEIVNEEKDILIGATIEYSSLFMYEATSKYCPQYLDKLMPVWRKNKTEIFAILLSDLEAKWRQYYISSIKAERNARFNGRKDKLLPDEYKKAVAEAKEAALVYKARTTEIRNKVTTDYETNRMQRSRFLPDLQRAIDSLVQYGIITDKSHISKDNQFAYFCYDPKFVPTEIEKLLEKNPEEENNI